jgi:hypothetical protein
MSLKYTPLSVADLRFIAKSLAEWERLLTNGSGYKSRADLVSRIEVTRPWSDGVEVIGHFVLVDGWVGFTPLGTD